MPTTAVLEGDEGTNDAPPFPEHIVMNGAVRSGGSTQTQLPVLEHFYDGFQIHRAALSYGLTVLALPRQVLLAGPGSAVPAAVSFTHGVPEASTVSAVTHAQDRRLRRALLERAGIPVPKGATFTWQNADRAVRWATRELGFPVVVKETVGENPARMIPDVGSDEELYAAFQVLRQRNPEDRTPGRNPAIAGYAATRLGFQLDEDGNQVAPRRTRFLIEQQLYGCYVRVFTCDDAAPVAVILDRSAGQAVQDVSAEVDPSVRELAVRAVRSIPGLAAGTVDIIMADPGAPVDAQECHVVEVAERPRAHTYLTTGHELGDRIGDALLEFQAAKAGLRLPASRDEVTADVRIEGLRDATSVAGGFHDVAAERGVSGDMTVIDDLDGVVTGSCHGTPTAIAALNESLMNAAVLDDRAACIESRVSAV